MTTVTTLVRTAFADARTYANDATSRMTTFLSSLNTSIYAPPSISVTWNSLTAPTLDSLPEVPALPTIQFAAPSGQPGSFAPVAPTINIDSFDEEAPELNLPSVPNIVYGQAPTIPSIGAVAVPAAPTISAPSVPAYLTLSAVGFGGVDLREDWLDRLEDIPELDLVAPTPYRYARGAEYASALLDSLKGRIQQRLAGGTGLDPAAEQAIWDRGRDRETKIALANEQDILRSSEALGFQLPAGVVAAQVRAAQQAYYDKLSDLSRDVMVKQAELEQQNLKDAIAAGMQLEGQLIDYSYKLEQLTFESAKEFAANAIQVHGAALQRYTALLEGYKTYASVYKTIIDAELAKVEVYKAQLSAEETKASVNNALVQQYKAQIEASMAQVEIYRAQVGAAQTLVQLEQAKIGAAGEQIKAYVAQVNAETAKVEAYKAQVTAEATKVDVYRTKAQAFSAKSGAQAESARANIALYSAQAQAYTAQWEGYRAKIGAEQARIQALGLQSNALLDGYKAAATATTAKAEMHTKVWETQIRQYEAGQNITLQAAKINADNLIATNNARLDAAKVGAQVYAQLTASAYNIISANANANSQASNSVSYQYSNETTSDAPTYALIGT